MIERSCIKILFCQFLLCVFSFILIKPLFYPIFSFFLFSIYFFRDPKREIGTEIVSPADGRIDYLSGQRIEIFMSPFDCHVNRSPVSGKVVDVKYTKGKIKPAFLKEKNPERNEIFIKDKKGNIFKVTQIAGIFARRIVCFVKQGDDVKKGQKIGMIRFGSRVVLEVPKDYTFVKNIGEKIKAGETIAVEQTKRRVD